MIMCAPHTTILAGGVAGVRLKGGGGALTGYACDCLPAVALAMLAPWPAAGPAHAVLQFLLGAPDAAFSRGLLFGVLHPADELVASQRRDVVPGVESRSVCHQGLAQVAWQLVDDASRDGMDAHDRAF